MKKKYNQGFSLVELVLAVAILGIIMLAIASFMSTTTTTYTRTKNDTELQRTGQEVFDMISDKIMQASYIRIGRDGKEYVIEGTNQSVLATCDTCSGTGRVVNLGTTLDCSACYGTGKTTKLAEEDGTPVAEAGNSYPLYSFAALSEDNTKNIEYISIYYEGYVDFAGEEGYGKIIDTYYFDSTEHAIYLYRYAEGVRASSKDSVTPEGTYANNPITNTGTADKQQLADTFFDGTNDGIIKIKELGSLTDKEEHLVCKNVTSMHGYAVPEENAIYLQIDLDKSGMTNVAMGMITIRNSYVLQPRPEK